jgi:hypothetical protein
MKKFVAIAFRTVLLAIASMRHATSYTATLSLHKAVQYQHSDINPKDGSNPTIFTILTGTPTL